MMVCLVFSLLSWLLEDDSECFWIVKLIDDYILINVLARKPSTVEERSYAIVNKLEVLDQRLASKVTF